MKLTITLTDNKELHMEADTPLTPLQLIDLTLSANLAMMNATLKSAPNKDKQKIKEYLFDTFNVAASSLLAQFAPDIPLRPDITEEAIIQLEEELKNAKH